MENKGEKLRIIHELNGNFYLFRNVKNYEFYIIYALKPGEYFDFNKAYLLWSYLTKFNKFEKLAEKTKKFWHMLYFLNKYKNDPDYFLLGKTHMILTHEKYIEKISLFHNDELYSLFLIHNKLFIPEELEGKIYDLLERNKNRLPRKLKLSVDGEIIIPKIYYDDFDIIYDEKIKFAEVIK